MIFIHRFQDFIYLLPIKLNLRFKIRPFFNGNYVSISILRIIAVVRIFELNILNRIGHEIHPHPKMQNIFDKICGQFANDIWVVKYLWWGSLKILNFCSTQKHFAIFGRQIIRFGRSRLMDSKGIPPIFGHPHNGFSHILCLSSTVIGLNLFTHAKNGHVGSKNCNQSGKQCAMVSQNTMRLFQVFTQRGKPACKPQDKAKRYRQNDNVRFNFKINLDSHIKRVANRIAPVQIGGTPQGGGVTIRPVDLDQNNKVIQVQQVAMYPDYLVFLKINGLLGEEPDSSSRYDCAARLRELYFDFKTSGKAMLGEVSGQRTALSVRYGW